MKKILAFVISVLLVASLTVACFAAPDDFVSSPTGKDAPTLIEAVVDAEECEAEILICSYTDRATLPEEAIAILETAYSSIVEADSFSETSKDLVKWAEKRGIAEEKLAVSDIFDIYYAHCDSHDAHKGITITLTPRVAENFVGILHYFDGQWSFVEDFHFEENGVDLTFKVDSLSPFAIVVHDGSAVPTEPSAAPLIVACVCFAALLIIIAIVIILLLKKKSEAKSK